MNVCTGFYGNPSNSCGNILLRNKNVNLMHQKKITQFNGTHPLGTMSVHKFRAIHPNSCGDISRKKNKHKNVDLMHQWKVTKVSGIHPLRTTNDHGRLKLPSIEPWSTPRI